jgi:hypothetical protein
MTITTQSVRKMTDKALLKKNWSICPSEGSVIAGVGWTRQMIVGKGRCQSLTDHLNGVLNVFFDLVIVQQFQTQCSCSKLDRRIE